MVTKKVRTEYMKRFRDPKWETFSRCYEDSLRYRLTRRVLEQAHKPWFWQGWDGGSDSSGGSTPRPSSNRIVPLSLPTSLETNPRWSGPGAELRPEEEEEEGEGEVEQEVAPVDAGQAAVPSGVDEASGAEATHDLRPSGDPETDDGPAADTGSSDGEPGNPAAAAGPRHGRRTAPSQPGHQNKPPRAKSQPAIGTQRTTRQGPSEGRTENSSEAYVRTHRGSSKRSCDLDRRRARSADLEKAGTRPQLRPVDERWMTEYMRCFSARLR